MLFLLYFLAPNKKQFNNLIKIFLYLLLIQRKTKNLNNKKKQTKKINNGSILKEINRFFGFQKNVYSV